MEWYEAEVRGLESRDMPPASPVRPVAFYGSSSIRLWENLRHDFAPVEVVNLGFGGSTLAACVWFFDRLVPPRNPRSLVFYAGDNDLGDGRHPDEVIASYHALQSKITERLGAIPFAFISIKPSPARWYLIEAIRKVNDAVRKDLVCRPHCAYIDLFTPMLGGGGYPRRELFAEDGLHLSSAGYAVWREEVKRHSALLF